MLCLVEPGGNALISRTGSVTTMAKTPSLSASTRPVPTSSRDCSAGVSSMMVLLAAPPEGSATARAVT